MSIWILDESQEVMRDRVRLWFDMNRIVGQQRQQSNHFLLCYGHVWQRAKGNKKHRIWMKHRKFLESTQQLALVASQEVFTNQERRLYEFELELKQQAETWSLHPLVQ